MKRSGNRTLFCCEVIMQRKTKAERGLLRTVLVLLFIILVVILLCYLPENLELREFSAWRTK